MRMTGVELATAVGTYVAADAERKQELRERYGFRFLAQGGNVATPDMVDDAGRSGTDGAAPWRACGHR